MGRRRAVSDTEVKVMRHGMTVTYNEGNDMWTVDDAASGITLSSKTLTGIDAAIVRALASQKKGEFKRFKAYMKRDRYAYRASEEDFVEVEVTSVVTSDYWRHGKHVWINILPTTPNGRTSRMKVDVGDLYKAVPMNKTRLNTLASLRVKVKKLEDDIRATEDAMPKVTTADLTAAGWKETAGE